MGFITFSLSEWRCAQESLSWPSVPGVIAEAGTQGRRGTPAVYVYEVDGQQYRSVNSRFGLDGAPRLQVGDPVTVYVNPADARDAVLSPGARAGDLFVVVFGLMFLLLAWGMWSVKPAA